MDLSSFPAVSWKRRVREPGGNAAPGHEKILQMSGEKAIRSEVRKLKGQDTGGWSFQEQSSRVMREWDTHPDSDEGGVWCPWLVLVSKELYTARTGWGWGAEWLKGVARRSAPSPEAQWRKYLAHWRGLRRRECPQRTALRPSPAVKGAFRVVEGGGCPLRAPVDIMGRVSRGRMSEVLGHERDVWEREWGLSDFTGSLNFWQWPR